MSLYEILPALDLTQSVHAKISIGMHWGQILNFQNTFDGPWNEIRMKIQAENFVRNPNLNEITSIQVTLKGYIK
jgi:L-ascorbate metabolism protein UlaG (beta-lactamase superfamily)